MPCSYDILIKGRKIKLVIFENNTVERKLLRNSAQRVFTAGGELYVVFPLGNIFLLRPYDVCTANKKRSEGESRLLT